MKTAIVNIGTIVSGDWQSPFAQGDAIVMDAGRIASVGTASATDVESADVVIDAAGATVIPGLIDSQVHNTFGDYTPRQKTVGFLESYVHGAVTTAISASEVHVPGRPHDPAGVKALALAAQRCFEHFRPGGGTQDTALAALKHGDPFAVGAVITDGEPRFVGQSRNTPAPKKRIRVAQCRLLRDFTPARH
jgi:dihydroorotase-like cyclic amidohydrolase